MRAWLAVSQYLGQTLALVGREAGWPISVVHNLGGRVRSAHTFSHMSGGFQAAAVYVFSSQDSYVDFVVQLYFGSVMRGWYCTLTKFSTRFEFSRMKLQ